MFDLHLYSKEGRPTAKRIDEGVDKLIEFDVPPVIRDGRPYYSLFWYDNGVLCHEWIETEPFHGELS